MNMLILGTGLQMTNNREGVRERAKPKLAQRTEQGRRLASQRDDLIADGIDPAELLIPLAPSNSREIPDQRKHDTGDTE